MSELKLIWYGHGTTKVVTSSGKKIIVDPFLTDNPACPPELRNDFNFDLLLVTHGHSDHFGDTIRILNHSEASVMCIFEMGNFLISHGIPADRVIKFNIGGTATFEGLKVTMTQALHSAAYYDREIPLNVGPPIGFVLTTEDDRKIYFAGDTDVFMEMQLIGELHKPFLAVLPIDGYFNMSPEAAAKAAELLQCDEILPVHHSTFPVLWGKPEMLQNELEERGLSGVTVHITSPGREIIF